MIPTSSTVLSINWCIPLDKNTLTLRQIALFGILGALTFAAKVAMSLLPNIEPVSLLVMLYAVIFGRKCVFPIYLYVAMEILFYGISLWNINYLYVWAVLAVSAGFCRQMDSALGWALLSGVFGLLFGALCGIVDIFIGGFGYAVTKWISGIPFDISHCLGNFFIALVLFRPLRKLLESQYAKMSR